MGSWADMPWAEYFALNAVNWSSLKRMDDSPLHYWSGIQNPTPDTPTLALGRYVHTAILRPDALELDFAIWTEGDRRGNAWKEFAAANAGRTIFKTSEIAEMAPIIQAVKANPHVQDLLSAGEAERALTWIDPETGIVCKCRPDWQRRDCRIVVDLKTTRSIEIRRFGNDIARLGYHGQLAHYGEGITHALGWTPEQHILIAVESAPPYDVGVFPLGEDVIEVGQQLVRKLLARLAECRASGSYPGRYPEPVDLDHQNLPPWVFGGAPEFEATEGEF